MVLAWFPVEAHPGDRLVAEFSGAGSIGLASVDGVTALAETLASAPATVLSGRTSVTIVNPWSPGRFGLAVEVLLSSEVVLRSLCYQPADDNPYRHPIIQLRAGHNVVPLGTDNGAAVTWGLQAAEPGRMPLPSLPQDEPCGPSPGTRHSEQCETSPGAGSLEEVLPILGSAYVRLDQHHCRMAANEASRQADLRRQIEAKSGIRGGAKEVLRSIPRRLWPAIDLPDAQELPLPWRALDPAKAATDPARGGKDDCSECRVPGRRVLVVSQMFPHPRQPGSGPFVLEQVKALRTEAGIDARVIAGIPYWMNVKQQPWQFWARNRVYWRNVSQAVWHDLEGVPVLYVPYRTLLGFWNHGRMYCAAMARVIEAVRADFAFDCVHAHTAYLDGSAGRWIARRYPRAPGDHRAHGTFFILDPRRPGSAVDHAGTPCGGPGDCGVRSAAARHGALHGRSQPAADRPSQRRRHVSVPSGGRPPRRSPQAADPFRGLFLRHQNLPLLLTAFARLRERIPAARLQLVGRGESPQDEIDVKRLVQELGIGDSVELLGFQSRESVARIMRESDFLVLSSRSESFGCVVTEALASGLPVVSTRCGGPEDIVTAPFLGRLCDNHDPEALAQAMFEVASNLDGFDPQRIRRYIQERFSYSALATNLDHVYRGLDRTTHAFAGLNPFPRSLTAEREGTP